MVGSSDTSAAVVSSPVTVRAGAKSAIFSIKTMTRATDTPVTITATLNGSSKAAVLTVLKVPPAVPCRQFSVDVNIELRRSGNGDNLQLKAVCTLGDKSNGIRPLVEPVSFKVGTSPLITIPAGSFRRDNERRDARDDNDDDGKEDGHFKFEGTINGVRMNVQINLKDKNEYDFHLEGRNFNLNGTANPVPVLVAIGDDTGQGADPRAKINR